MAIRQYIGARYTPKFMGTYDNTQVYEALDVVDNGQGTSYISKIPTPAGTPLTDTAHWQIYGASSGAVINLQNQINVIDNKLSHIKDRNFIFVGDSFSNGIYGARGWMELVIEILGLTHGVNEYDARPNVGGGFGVTFFEDQLNAVYNSITNPESITDIYVFGGHNDHDKTTDTIISGIDSFIATAKTLYPNAVVHIGYVGRSTNRNAYSLHNRATKAYIDGCRKNGADYITNSEYINRLYSDYNADKIHPNSFIDMAQYIASAITDGHIDVQRSAEIHVPLTVNGTGTIILFVTQSNDVTSVQARLYNLTNVSAVPSATFDSGEQSGLKIADWELHDLINCDMTFDFWIANDNSTSGYEVDHIALDITETGCYLRGMAVERGGWITYPASNRYRQLNLPIVTYSTLDV